MSCCVTLLVVDEELIVVDGAWLVLAPILVAASVPCDVPEEVPIVVVEEDVIGMVVVPVELGTCVSLLVDVSTRRDVGKNPIQ